MRKNRKRLFKGLLATGVVFALVGCGVLIGLMLGLSEGQSRHSAIGQNEIPYRFHEEVVIAADERSHEEMAREVAEQVERIEVAPIPSIPTIPPIPTIPAIPTIQPIPPIPAITPHVYIDHGPTFFDVVNGIGTILASFGLIGLGIAMIVRGWRAPKEKRPESLLK